MTKKLPPAYTEEVMRLKQQAKRPKERETMVAMVRRARLNAGQKVVGVL